jgi:hypothetical protein
MEAKSPVVGNKLPSFKPLVLLVVEVAAGLFVAVVVGAVVSPPVDGGGVGFSQAANKKPLAMVAILKAREILIFDIVKLTPQIFRNFMHIHRVCRP